MLQKAKLFTILEGDLVAHYCRRWVSVLKVREIHRGIELPEEKTLAIQHYQRGGPITEPFREADLRLCCYPKELPKKLRRGHILRNTPKGYVGIDPIWRPVLRGGELVRAPILRVTTTPFNRFRLVPPTVPEGSPLTQEEINWMYTVNPNGDPTKPYIN